MLTTDQPRITSRDWVRDDNEYPTCQRCGYRISPESRHTACSDCRTLDTHSLGPARQRPYPHHPYTITVYDRRTGTFAGPTFDALHEHQLRHEVVNVIEDPFAYYYLMADLGHHNFPMVTVTQGADLVTSWEGHRPDMIASIAAMARPEEAAA